MIGPPLTPTDIDAALATARQLVEAGVTLTEPELGFELIPSPPPSHAGAGHHRDEAVTFEVHIRLRRHHDSGLRHRPRSVPGDRCGGCLDRDRRRHETVSILPSVPPRARPHAPHGRSVGGTGDRASPTANSCTPMAARRTSRPQMPKDSASPASSASSPPSTLAAPLA